MHSIGLTAHVAPTCWHLQVANAAVDFDGPEHPGHLYGDEDVDPLPMG